MIHLVFLGCGRIARDHAKRLRRHRADVAVGFASRDPARAAQFARELGGESYASYEDALASPRVDAVAIVTPPSSHLELALRALAARKHVILEKPALPRAADLDQVAREGARVGKQIFVAENYFYKPVLARLRELITDGAIGEVLFIHINAIKQQFTAGDWRFDPALAVGGALYEGGIHWIDFMANLGLEVRAVRGFRPAMPARAAIERSMMVVFEYAEGAVGTLSYSWEVPATARGLRLSKIYGRGGSITFETNGLWILSHGKKTRFYGPQLRDLTGHRPMWADFIRAWQTGTEPAMSLARARHDLELVEQAYASAASS